MALQIDADYVNKVFRTMSSNPTGQDLDFLLEAYARIGYYVAVANGDADFEEAQLDYDEANAKRDYKLKDPKASAVVLDSHATINTWPQRQKSIKARTEARKLYNMYQSLEQTIHAVKFIGRMDTSVRIGP